MCVITVDICLTYMFVITVALCVEFKGTAKKECHTFCIYDNKPELPGDYLMASLCLPLSPPGAVPGGPRGDDRARGPQWHEASGPCRGLQEHIRGGCTAQEGGQDR